MSGPLYLNRDSGGTPFELHLDIRVNGEDIDDAADSVAEYVRDHAPEVLVPVFPETLPEPKSRKFLDDRRAELRKYLADNYGDDVVLLDGPEFDDGIIGVSEGRLVYSYTRLLEALMAHNEWDEQTARDWLDVNTLRSLPYMGEHRPMVVDDLEILDIGPASHKEDGDGVS